MQALAATDIPPSAGEPKTDAERVKYAREDRGWSQTQLAEKLGVSHSFIAQIESGRCGVPRMRRVQFMDVLGIDLPRRPR